MLSDRCPSCVPQFPVSLQKGGTNSPVALRPKHDSAYITVGVTGLDVDEEISFRNQEEYKENLFNMSKASFAGSLDTCPTFQMAVDLGTSRWSSQSKRQH